jgi:uracil-DNA glycosylase family 4
MTGDGRQGIASLEAEIVACRRCPRLVAWRERVAVEKVRRHAGEEYWGRPVPSFGDPSARLLVVGLAPAAHGANRTGRMFTGDRSGDWLYRALFRAGFANQPTSTSRDDGLGLRDCYITAVARCAPPDNKPLPTELASCRPFLERELELLSRLRAVVALGGIAFDVALRTLRDAGRRTGGRKPRFSHGGETDVGGIVLLGSYHPSQQNTFTGRLTEPMLDEVFARARELVDS